MAISKNLPDRFIELRPFTKKPKSKKWNTTPPKCFNEVSSLVSVGLLLGDGFIGIDCDTKEMERVVEEQLKTPTYSQISAKRGMKQFIYRVNAPISYTTLKDEKGDEVGEILGEGRQIVISPSKYKITAEDVKKDPLLNLKIGNIKEYRVLNDVPIAEITLSQLMSVVDRFKSSYNQREETIKRTENKIKSKILGVTWNKEAIDELDITSIIDLSGLKETGSGQYYGSNVWHDSTGGENFRVTPSKNLAYCFRCGCAISPAKAIALNEGIISNCDSPLNGDRFIQTLEVARERYGLDDGWLKLGDYIKQQNKETLSKGKKDKLEPLEFMTIKDYENYKPPKDYIIKGVKYPNEITMSYGQTNSFKSLGKLYEALCIASGKKLFGKIPTKKQPVAILSAEDNTKTTKLRLKKLMRGLGIRNKNLPLYILPRNKCGDILERTFKKKLVLFIKERGIKCLYLDTINPLSPSIDDLVGRDVTRIFNDFLRPFSDELGVAIDFLHHTPKTGKTPLGSTKWKANSESVFKFYRNGLSSIFYIQNEKNKEGENSTWKISLEFLDNQIKVKLLSEKQPEILNEPKKSKGEVLREAIRKILKDQPKAERKDVLGQLKKQKVSFAVSTFGRIWGEEK